jgi:UDP-3-O-[3-hydroxymyristoyl] glucosamine N-acyltransferase
MKLDRIIEILRSNSIDFEIFGIHEEYFSIEYRLASLKQIIPNGIYFLSGNVDFPSCTIQRGIVLSEQKMLDENNLCIVVPNPQMVHYLLSNYVPTDAPSGIHPTAIISENAVLSNNLTIGAYCVIGNVRIGEGVVINHHVVLEDGVEIGSGTLIDSHSVIGAAGYAWVWAEDGKRIRQKQLGGVVVEENCCIGTDVTIVKGSLSENTIVGNGTIISHGSKIGHGCRIGKDVHFANNVSLAGNAVIGDKSFLGSACVISSNVHIAKATIVGAGAVVSKSVDEEHTTLAGVPARIIKRNNFEEKPKGVPKPLTD